MHWRDADIIIVIEYLVNSVLRIFIIPEWKMLLSRSEGNYLEDRLF
ncbi:MAG TPA: hypothetical protein VMX38_05990 [Verrucomicrobiae bacterium]|nr:hypothetical protein [Verrucomicrobiae bacterium]